jgi:hypothetical protein
VLILGYPNVNLKKNTPASYLKFRTGRHKESTLKSHGSETNFKQK